jgi:microsomal dipeptidase-like Zn-dependent dipeptidase
MSKWYELIFHALPSPDYCFICQTNPCAMHIADLHCDLLSYLAAYPEATPYDTQRIGCAIPWLRQGNISHQVLAIYTATFPGSTELGMKQVLRFASLVSGENPDMERWHQAEPTARIQVLPAIENASVFCEEDEPLEMGFERLEKIVEITGPFAYLIMTHHAENRFGGGNYTQVGLKPDGEKLLDYLNGKGIPIDLSHTCDLLARDILNYLDRKNLEIPVLASHTNYRAVWDHPRNFSEETARELIARGGIIGSNFVRAFVHPEDPQALARHFWHGWEGLAGKEAVAFGADFFAPESLKDPSRYPVFFPDFNHAGTCHKVLEALAEMGLDNTGIQAIAHGNVCRYFERVLPHL